MDHVQPDQHDWLPTDRLPLNGFQIRAAAPVVPPESLEITQIVRKPGTKKVTLTWKSNPCEIYGLYWSDDLDSFTLHGVHHAVPAHASATHTTLGPIPSPLPDAEKLFFRIGPPDKVRNAANTKTPISRI